MQLEHILFSVIINLWQTWYKRQVGENISVRSVNVLSEWWLYIHRHMYMNINSHVPVQLYHFLQSLFLSLSLAFSNDVSASVYELQSLSLSLFLWTTLIHEHDPFQGIRPRTARRGRPPSSISGLIVSSTSDLVWILNTNTQSRCGWKILLSFYASFHSDYLDCSNKRIQRTFWNINGWNLANRVYMTRTWIISEC